MPDYIKKVDKRESKNAELKGKKKIIDLFSDVHRELPITRIIVGPHSKKEENIQTLTKILKDTNIKLDVSEIPFLD
jgi:hypothetical protein